MPTLTQRPPDQSPTAGTGGAGGPDSERPLALFCILDIIMSQTHHTQSLVCDAMDLDLESRLSFGVYRTLRETLPGQSQLHPSPPQEDALSPR